MLKTNWILQEGKWEENVIREMKIYEIIMPNGVSHGHLHTWEE